jgi:6-phosphogluconate dehydrogenase (decarboxylating)
MTASMEEDFKAFVEEHITRVDALSKMNSLRDDPAAVHLNMLRGTIAKPTVEQIIHLYGVDAICRVLSPVTVRETEEDYEARLANIKETAMREIDVRDCLHTSAFQAGVRLGWNFGVAGDEDGFRRAASSTEHVAELKRIRALEQNGTGTRISEHGSPTFGTNISPKHISD